MSQMKLEFTPAEYVQLGDAFVGIEQIPAWQALTAITEAEINRTYRAAIVDKEHPREFFEGFLGALEWFLGLPELIRGNARTAREILDEEERVRSEVKEQARAVRLVTTGGEVTR